MGGNPLMQLDKKQTTHVSAIVHCSGANILMSSIGFILGKLDVVGDIYVAKDAYSLADTWS